jgi:hypothetical protein
MSTTFYLLDCDHKAIGNPMGYQKESIARAVANNPKSKAHALIKKAWRRKIEHFKFLDNRYQNFESCYCIETFHR